jgi:hypothetical protein
MPWSDEVKVPTERILLRESPFRAGAALKRTLVTFAERPAVDFSPAGEPEHLPPLPHLHQPSSFCLRSDCLRTGTRAYRQEWRKANDRNDY